MMHVAAAESAATIRKSLGTNGLPCSIKQRRRLPVSGCRQAY